MPVITFDKQHLDQGFMFLARHGEVGCLPNDVFVITEPLFDSLQQSGIPFQQIENRPTATAGDIRAENAETRQADSKVSV
jgi:hypothetical protein